MTRQLWVADCLREAGCDVYEMPGWETSETRSGFDPQGIVCHHTATGPNWLDGHVALLLRRGRSDLSGPLSQFGLERDGTWVCIAAGRCNHNGYGTWGNDSFGVEAYNNGMGEIWPQVQIDSYEVGTAALCEYKGWNIAQVRGHKETDPGRKIDPTFNMDQFRAEVHQVLNPPVIPVESEDDMAEIVMKAKGKTTRYSNPPIAIPVGASTIKGLTRGTKPVPVRTFTPNEYDAYIAQITRALDEKE